MRALGLLLSAIAIMAFVGCGDEDPVSSVPEEELSIPAAKLTVSRTIAGGYRPGMVPFEAYLVGVVAVDEDAERCGGDLPRIMDVRGEATYLGESRFFGRHCFWMEDLVKWKKPGDPVRLDRGEAIWTAADGDELHVRYTGLFQPISLTPPEGPYTAVLRFTGGTGRFEGAKGALATSGYSSPGETGIDALCEGLISAPAE